ncbi:MAG: PAS domain S-box protein [Arcobacteraceae bacterium]|nr:PAS domain S-box protein [Arcobacteraceae bacterium]
MRHFIFIFFYLVFIIVSSLVFLFGYVSQETAWSLLIIYLLFGMFILIQTLTNIKISKQLELLKKEKDDILFKMQMQEKMLFLQSQQASLGELIGNVSHQWKEPLGGLGAILSNIQATLILKGEVTKEKLNDSIEKSYKIIYHLSDTISVFYRFFRSQKSDKKEFSIYEEITNIGIMVSYSMKIEHISLKFDCDKDIFAYGDRGEFVNAILNIILNAKDILIWRKIKEPFIELKVWKEDNNITITIQDNGGGIYQEPIEKIFEYSISSKPDSTGIGLFIVKNIIENRLHGSIKVYNKKNGALFTISLPATYKIFNNNQMISYDVEEKAYDKIARLEKELAKQSEVEKTLRQWEDIFTQTHWGVAVHKGTSNHFEMVNPAFYNMYGYNTQELKNITAVELYADESLAILPLKQKEAFEKSFVSFEAIHVRKNGSRFPVNIDLTVIKNEYDEILYHIANVRDIMELKESQKELLLKKFAINKIHESVFLIDKNSKFRYVNEGACKALGYTSDELLNLSVGDIDPDWPSEKWSEYWEVLKQETTMTMKLRHKRKDGSIFPVEVVANYIEYENESYNMALARDITERLESEKRKDDDKIRLFFERQLVGMAITSPTKGWLHVNNKLCEILGYTFEELQNMTWAEMTHPDDLAKDITQFNRLLLGEIEDYILEKRFIHINGNIIYTNLAVCCVRNDDHSVNYALALLEDITERKKAEEEIKALNSTLEQRVVARTEELAKKEREFRTLAENMPDFLIRYDKYKRRLYVNPAFCRYFEISSEELLGFTTYEKSFNKIPPEFYAKLDYVLQSGNKAQIEIEALKDGKRFWWNVIFVPEFDDDGNTAGVISIGHDISDIKEAQNKIIEEREKFSSIFQLSPSGIAISSLERMVYVDVNESLLGYIGYTKEEMIGRGTLELEIFSNPNERLEILKRLEKDGAVSDFEYSYKTKNGYIGNAMMYGKIITLNGEKCLLSHSYDITERKKIEILQKERLELEEKFSKIAVAAPGVNYIFEKTVDGIFRFTYLAATFEELSGLSNEVVLNDFTKSFEMIVPQDREKVLQSIISSAENLTSLHMEFRIMHHQKGILWVESQSKPEKLPDGTIVWYGFLYYITNRKNDEQKLGLLNKAIDNASDAVYIVKDDHSIYYVSDGACRMLGYTKEEFFTMKIEDIDPLMSTKEITVARNEVKKQQNLILHTKHRKKNGDIIDVEITGTEFNYDDFSLRLAIVKDISERKKYEEEILQLNRTLEHKVIERTLELQKALEFNKSIIQAIPDMLFEISKEGFYLNIWAKDDRLLASQKEILLGKNLEEVLPSDVARIAFHGIKDADMNGLSLGNIYKLKLPDGEHWFESSFTLIESKGTYLAVSRDVTEQKKAQSALIELNATLEEKVQERTYELQRALDWSEDIINTLPDLLFEMDSEGNYLNIWAQNKKLLAQQKDALLGNNIYNVLSKQSADTIIEAFKEADLKKVSVGKIITIDLPDGQKQFGLSISKKSDGNYLILSRELLGR